MLPVSRAADELGQALALHGVVVRDDAAMDGDTEVVSQAAQAAGVLGRDDVGGCDQVTEATGGVVRASDRGGSEHQETRGRRAVAG